MAQIESFQKSREAVFADNGLKLEDNILYMENGYYMDLNEEIELDMQSKCTNFNTVIPKAKINVAPIFTPDKKFLALGEIDNAHKITLVGDIKLNYDENDNATLYLLPFNNGNINLNNCTIEINQNMSKSAERHIFLLNSVILEEKSSINILLADEKKDTSFMFSDLFLYKGATVKITGYHPTYTFLHNVKIDQEGELNYQIASCVVSKDNKKPTAARFYSNSRMQIGRESVLHFIGIKDSIMVNIDIPDFCSTTINSDRTKSTLINKNFFIIPSSATKLDTNVGSKINGYYHIYNNDKSKTSIYFDKIYLKNEDGANVEMLVNILRNEKSYFEHLVCGQRGEIAHVQDGQYYYLVVLANSQNPKYAISIQEMIKYYKDLNYRAIEDKDKVYVPWARYNVKILQNYLDNIEDIISIAFKQISTDVDIDIPTQVIQSINISKEKGNLEDRL